MLPLIIGLIIGYFIGVVSCISQVIHMETRDNRRIKDILEDN